MKKLNVVHTQHLTATFSPILTTIPFIARTHSARNQIMAHSPKTALLIVDVQNDFLGGRKRELLAIAASRLIHVENVKVEARV